MRKYVLVLVMLLAGCEAAPELKPVAAPKAEFDPNAPLFADGAIVRHKLTRERVILVRHQNRADDHHIVDVCRVVGGNRTSDVWSELECAAEE